MKSTLRNMTLSLGLLVVASGAILAGVKILTEEPIAEANEKARLEAFTEVLGGFDNNPAEGVVVLEDGTRVYPATLEGAPAGGAVEISAPQGFGGPFSLMVGFDAKGAVTGYRVLEHAETPGLGAKMSTWFADTLRASRNIIGRYPGGSDGHTGASQQAASPHGLAVSKDGGEIDAITGATITSRAFLSAVNAAADAFRKVNEREENKK
ncbi:MAG: RnfABCDGE type electron transport complex subunit G [Muribaculaceae bacterium]|nr:RnfABCDGE type electron transport complex subunit G [Muribaculaceae bacterium]